MKRKTNPLTRLVRDFLGRFVEKHPSPVNFELPADRQRILACIDPGSANVYHNVLKKIFLLEMEYREKDRHAEYFENLNWCGFLLYRVGDLEDVEMMWKAKLINMDTGVGFDIQCLVGAGIDNTFSYLERRSLNDILEYLNRCRKAGDLDDLSRWDAYQVRYFYGSQ